VFARRFDPSGIPIGNAVQLNTFAAGGHRFPGAAFTGPNDFVVVWESAGQDGDDYGIFGRRFNNPTAVPTSIVTTTPTVTPTPTVTTTPPTPTPSSTPGVGAADIDGDGDAQPLTDSLLVLRYLFGFRGPTLITGAVDLGTRTRCSAGAIEAHIAANLAAFDSDGNGSSQPLTDGLLALRYLFGFRGATLTTGAVDLATCTRCTAATIEPYITSLLP
jgi:hypothetical protein